MVVPGHKMSKKNNKDDLVQKDRDLLAFCNLVDRAHSLQLLKEKNQGLEKQLRNNFNGWQPSFEPEDFNLPPKRASTSTVDLPAARTRAAAGEGGGGGGDDVKEEKILKRGLKRPIHLVDLAPHCVPEEGLKKGDTAASKVLLCDLNKEAESSEPVNGGFGLNLELGIWNS
ncbi:hypothetical protein NE237_032224 [Protea cynaroides]|uniref:Uncharacterized protein n=1 Tax=Protea cynaroides TaxID=273540 RepID=A0A9Q0R393_9MAGN|nr:hypothetical protein NE237_032224 [Protea cynaroides]